MAATTSDDDDDDDGDDVDGCCNNKDAGMGTPSQWPRFFAPNFPATNCMLFTFCDFAVPTLDSGPSVAPTLTFHSGSAFRRATRQGNMQKSKLYFIA